ncbi:virulence factor [Salimicrobium halophilum]|uniref:PBS lyase HEAT-like repeat-containing protein n=1 Tax=Salimicrobium halophilum TaxID=86666 RepID=A0A1G8VTP5_9BACI|nr:virulence factor [Salimicrobium halophilum]SDJ69207.1 PBS lyase HEAT-like repeat-containing protein [Salimicrobium halophilum]
MRIVSIEPTPSPNSMKINVDESLPMSEAYNYTKDGEVSTFPSPIKELFDIDGVKGIYHVMDFLALERHPKVSWEEILPEVRHVLGSDEDTQHEKTEEKEVPEENFGEIQVFIQKFRNIPMQIKLIDGEEETRVGLPERFMNAAMEASAASENMIMERKWVEETARYGDPEEIGEQVKEEISASYDEERLRQLVTLAFRDEKEERGTPVTLETLDDPDWKVRYQALDQMDPTLDDLPVLHKALHDQKASIRRLATAYLGMIEEEEVLPYLYEALNDKTVTVRRTAGDCISDVGSTKAMPYMIESLKDPSKIVRWRAAMYLYEVGDETALPALREAKDDPEFEVRLQIRMALERIEGGKEAEGSVWHQMTQATKAKENN